MDDAVVHAAAGLVKGKINRANGLLRDAGQQLAALAGGQDALGAVCVHDRRTRTSAQELIALGISQYGAVDVVVLAHPRRRTHHGNGAKEHHHANSSSSKAPAAAR